jgi:hypothetical protein
LCRKIDLAIKSILECVPYRNLTELLNEALTGGGIDGAAKFSRDFKAAPINKYASTEDPPPIAGARLLGEMKPQHRRGLFSNRRLRS